MAVMDATLPRARFARVDKSKGVLGWLTTVDHKKIAIMYLFLTFFFFLVGGVMALLIRIQLAEPQNTFLTPEQYNQIFTMHGTTMIFLWIIPVWAGFGNYMVPLMIGARDMAFPRINALSFWLLPLGGLVMYSGFLVPATTHAGLLCPGGPGDAGWTGYVPLTGSALQLQHGPGPLDHRTPPARHLVDARRHQLPRDHPQHARQGHDLGTAAAVRVGAGDHRGAGRARLAVPRLGTGDEPARPPDRHQLLRPGQRRQRAALPVRVLVLLAPGGVHHDPARVRDHQRDHPGVQPKTDLRLQGDGRLHRGDRRARLHRVRAPHVRHRTAACGADVLRLHDLRHRGADRGEDLQLACHDVGREHQIRHAHALRVRLLVDVPDRRH